MRLLPLASSSHGNAYLVEDGKTRILLECGLSYRKLQQATGFSLAGVSACFISHEHKDHSGCFRELLKNGMPVYASEGTAMALGCGDMEVLPASFPSEGEGAAVVTVGTLEVLAFRVFHDAAEPLGFLVGSREDGDTLAFATDTVNLDYSFPGVNILAVECNYDSEILARHTRMPDKVRRRIENSHMEVGRLCTWLKGLPLDKCREIWLLHLSDACSDEERFIYQVRRAVGPGIRVAACPKILEEGGGR